MLAETGQNIEKSVDILRNNGLVAIPTETVYGLAANGFNQTAVAKIFEAKNRPFFDPLILHISNAKMLNEIVTKIPQKASQLMEKFWPGPLTFVLQKSNKVPDLVTSGHSTVAVRMPNHPLTLSLLDNLEFPLAAPSANPFGYVSPTTAKHVFDQLGSKIPYILDGGSCEVGLESTIISFENELNPTILRLGGISQEKIEEIIGKVSCNVNQNSNPQAPGQLDQHYSPYCKLLLINNIKLNISNIPKILFFSPVTRGKYFENNMIFPHEPIYLSENNDLVEAASKLFSTLRDFDQKGYDTVFIEMSPDQGIGRAINDRLTRAMVKRH